jgi:tetratricopeptide (TPR) repeat protein
MNRGGTEQDEQPPDKLEPSRRTSSLLRWFSKPSIWVSGIIVATLGSVLKGAITPAVELAIRPVRAIACEIHHPRVPPDPHKLTILVSPLAGDDDGSQFNLLSEALIRQDGFRAQPLCEQVDFDFSLPLDIAKTEAVKRAMTLTAAYQADVVMFGRVRKEKPSIKIWVVNENGGCDEQLKAVDLEEDPATGVFMTGIEKDLVATTLEAVSGACLGHQLDPSSFRSRLDRLRYFLDHSAGSLPVKDQIAIAYHYSNGERILFGKQPSLQRIDSVRNFDLSEVSSLPSNIDLESRFNAVRAICDIDVAIADGTGDTNGLQDAERVCTKAINLGKSLQAGLLSDAFSDRSAIYGLLGNWKAALNDSTEALRLSPNAIGFANRAYYEEWLGLFAEGEADARKAIELDPSFPGGYTQLGDVLLAAKKYQDSLSQYEKATQLDPSEKLAYIGMGTVYTIQGKYDDAIAIYLKAVSTDPMDRNDLHSLIAAAYAGKKDVQRAREEYNIAVRLHPQDARDFNNRANFYYSQSDWSRAISDYSEAMRLQPNTAEYPISRGNVHSLIHDWASAIADYSIAIGINPANGAFYYQRADAELALSQWREANADASKAIALSDANSSYFNSRGFSFDMIGQKQKAMDDYNKSISIQPNLKAFSNRANLWLAIGEPTKAIADYDQVIQLAPHTLRYRVYRARAVLATGDSAAARRDAQKLLTTDGALPYDRAAAYVVLGLCDEHDGEQTLARAEFRRALEVPHSSDALAPGIKELLEMASDNLSGK